MSSYGTQSFITVLITALTGPCFQLPESILYLHMPYYSQIHFNIIFPPTPRSPKQYLPFRLGGPHRQSVCGGKVTIPDPASNQVLDVQTVAVIFLTELPWFTAIYNFLLNFIFHSKVCFQVCKVWYLLAITKKYYS